VDIQGYSCRVKLSNKAENPMGAIFSDDLKGAKVNE